MRFLFVPTLNSVRVSFTTKEGVDFAFVSPRGKRTFDKGTTFTVADNRNMPCSFDTLLGDPKHLPSTKLVTDSLSASVCLGCFLHANEVLAVETPGAIPSDLGVLRTGEPCLGTLTAFPTRARVLTHVFVHTAHRCDMCISTYKTTGIWYEAGVVLDEHTHAVVEPTITPFQRTIMVCTTVDNTSLKLSSP
jgi:hypothetical protein